MDLKPMTFAETTEERCKLIDDLAGSISRLCHRVIARRLEQFFKVIGEEVTKESGALTRLMDAVNREPGESLLEWESRVIAVRDSIRSAQGKSGERT